MHPHLSSCLQYVITKSSNVFKVKLQGLKQSVSRMSRSINLRFQSMSLIVYARMNGESQIYIAEKRRQEAKLMD